MARLVAALDADCCPIDVAVLAYLGPDERREIDRTAGGPTPGSAVRARSLRTLAARVRDLAARTEAFARVASSESIKQLKRLSEDAQASSEAARLASDAAFRSEPLSGVGSEAWRLMQEAAKEYSEKDAYPSNPFPVTLDSSVCVLCQQPLTPTGAERMRRFDRFVSDRTATKAADNEKALLEKAKPLREVNTEPEKADPTLLDELRAIDSELCEVMLTEFDSLRDARELCLRAVASGDWSGVKAPVAV